MIRDEKHRVLVFPRYHQLDVIRQLQAAIVKEGVGNNYLIQHTTGSGKSNSIAWLAHLLTHLYRSPTDTNRIFRLHHRCNRSALYLTSSFRRRSSRSDRLKVWFMLLIRTSAQLRGFLESGKSIIISTIQKFSVIAEEIGANSKARPSP